MTPDPFVELLRAADRNHPAPPADGQLAQRVRRTARRRQRVRTLLAGGIGASALILALFHRLPQPAADHPPIVSAGPVSPAPPSSPSPPSSDPALAQLTAEAILRLRGQNLALVHLSPIAPLARLDINVNQTALIFLQIGDDTSNPADRRAAYQRLVQSFPYTPAANAARERLARLTS